jgi:hypothetical protein
MSREEANEFPDPEQVKELLLCMGLGLVGWEHVEDEHYLLFRKLLNYPMESVSSALYHGSPSFESKRVLLDRVMVASIVPTAFQTEWRKVIKELADASDHRGQIAHFGLGFEVEYLGDRDSQELNYKLVSPHLRPSMENKLKSSRNKGHENPKYRVAAAQLSAYVQEFTSMAGRVREFRKTLIVAKMPPGKAPKRELPPRPISKVMPLLIRARKK